jgi:hypothetical protein
MLDKEQAVEHLKQAHRTPRCVHLKMDGVQCGSPALKGCAYCYAHARLAMRHPARLALPFLEDANSVQSAIMEVMKGLLDGDIDRKTAGLLLYGLQMATCNLKNVCFEPKDPKSVVRDALNLKKYCDFETDPADYPEGATEEPKVWVVPDPDADPNDPPPPPMASGHEVGYQTKTEMLDAIAEVHRMANVVVAKEKYGMRPSAQWPPVT